MKKRLGTAIWKLAVALWNVCDFLYSIALRLNPDILSDQLEAAADWDAHMREIEQFPPGGVKSLDELSGRGPTRH